MLNYSLRFKIFLSTSHNAPFTANADRHLWVYWSCNHVHPAFVLHFSQTV